MRRPRRHRVHLPGVLAKIRTTRMRAVIARLGGKVQHALGLEEECDRHCRAAERAGHGEAAADADDKGHRIGRAFFKQHSSS
jgi:hypothetical protein